MKIQKDTINLLDALNNMQEPERNELLSEARMLPGEWDNFYHTMRKQAQDMTEPPVFCEACGAEIIL